jgi:hypothetical protein
MISIDQKHFFPARHAIIGRRHHTILTALHFLLWMRAAVAIRSLIPLLAEFGGLGLTTAEQTSGLRIITSDSVDPVAMQSRSATLGG